MRTRELMQSEAAKSEVRANLAGREVNYITISRQPGSGGDEIAKILADLLKWQLYDKEVLNYMSQNMQVQQGR